MDSAEPVYGREPTAVLHAQHPAQPFRENAETAPAAGEPAMAAFSGGCDACAALDPALGAVLFSFTYCQAPTQSSLGDRGGPAGQRAIMYVQRRHRPCSHQATQEQTCRAQ